MKTYDQKLDLDGLDGFIMFSRVTTYVLPWMHLLHRVLPPYSYERWSSWKTYETIIPTTNAVLS